MCDNTSAIAMTRNHVFHLRLKHTREVSIHQRSLAGECDWIANGCHTLNIWQHLCNTNDKKPCVTSKYKTHQEKVTLHQRRLAGEWLNSSIVNLRIKLPISLPRKDLCILEGYLECKQETVWKGVLEAKQHLATRSQWLVLFKSHSQAKSKEINGGLRLQLELYG